MFWPYTTISESAHGGHCCGMTHIHTFPAEPKSLIEARKAKTPAEWTSLQTQNPYWYGSVMNDDYPEQTGGERLKMMIARIEEGYDGSYCREGRPMGIIEIVLTDSQVTSWGETLAGLGFRNVNSAMNSNSDNNINVFHRNSGE